MYLCLESCVNAEVTKQLQYRPLYASSRYAKRSLDLCVYCKQQKRNIGKFIGKCKYYQNTTLLNYQKDIS